MHPEVDRFAHLPSPVHRWAPPLKLLGMGGLMFAVASLRSPAGALAAFGVAVGLTALSGIPLAFVAGRLKWVALFMAPLLVLMPLGVGRSAGGGLEAGWSAEAFAWASVIVVRALTIALLVFPMLGTAPLHSSMRALRELAVPAPVVELMLFSYRYLFIYLDQLRKLRIAMAARGVRPALSPGSLSAHGNLIGMLLVRSFEDTERLMQAMKARGYDGEIQTFERTELAGRDWLKTALAALVAIGLIAGDRFWLS